MPFLWPACPSQHGTHQNHPRTQKSCTSDCQKLAQCLCALQSACGVRACVCPPAPHIHMQVSPVAVPSVQRVPLSTAGSLGSGLVSCHASRWLGSSPKPFLVPLPETVAPSRDTGAELSLSGCFPACQASHVRSCRDFPDGCLAPASSPSGWAGSWSIKPGQHIALAPALPPQLRALAPASHQSAAQLPMVPQPPCLGGAG